uniref:Uncharacterized protein n=1 Tax=Tetradesmus obliquus TaxID=3088 RepID=A0A383VLS0_TETOB|eukprot:jgi/Sobl393_1/15410/SZX65830.1
MPTAAAAAAAPVASIAKETPTSAPQPYQQFARPCRTPPPTTATNSSSSGINVHTAAPTTTISSSSTPGIPNAAPPAAVEIPPIAPSVPAPFTPPNSPLPTPHVPNPPFLATPPPPSIPPQLLPPCPGNQPPPQKLIPNAPTADKAPVRPASCDSSSCSSSGPAAETLGDVLAGDSYSSSNGGLLGLFRQQQGLQHRWQQALLHAAFADGAASQLAGQEPPALLLPDSIPPHSFSFLEGDAALPALPADAAAGTSWRGSAGGSLSSGSSFSSFRAMLATYAVADVAAAQAAEPSVGSIPSVLSADEPGSTTAAPKSSKKSASTSSSSTTSLSAAQDITAPATAAATSQSKKAEAASTNAAVQGLQQRWQGVQDVAQRDPGVSDFLKAAAKFGEAFVRVGLIVLRLLVQITAVLLQAAVKLLVWLLDWAGQRTADRVAAVRQQNAAQLGVAAVVQQQAGGQEKVMGMQVAMAAAAEQQAPDLAAPVV